ncbi:Cof-type HAD-IIB family hydrolase [Loigolactobacillus iwatensis]|uniref:Cof-type HAD-IIB family hydrolase n=1 Tax=Loigolactobacillus iwatensis TaxID=1267156 RepID=UPI000F7EEA07|nr:Cof-type HAD-IIB family hydrolase [Loigolactobacillus iwatensis]
MAYRALVFFDLDATLMNAQSRIDLDVQVAVRSLRAQNVLPIISTGRSPSEVLNIFLQTGINSFVSLNGAYVVYNGQPIYQGNIDQTLVGKITTIAEEHGDAVAYYNDKGYRVSRMTDTVKKQYQYVNAPEPEVDPNFYKSNPVYMLLIITKDNDKRYIYPYGEQLTFYRNSPYSMDTILKGESKQFGINTLIKKMGLEDVPTYAFGDGTNDIPMLNTVDHPIAMGNGITAVKDRAEYITAKNTEGGIIQGLRHFNLLR